MDVRLGAGRFAHIVLLGRDAWNLTGRPVQSPGIVGGGVYAADMADAPISTTEAPAVDVAFSRAVDVFDGVAAQVPARGWGDASPCEGWTVRDVVEHVIGTIGKAAVILRGESFPTGPSLPGGVADDNPLEAWRAAVRPAREVLRSADMSQEVDTPHGRRTMAGALAFPAADLAVHSWDMAYATAQSFELPDELLAHIVATCDQVPENTLRGPNLFGPARLAPRNANDTTALMAWLGRDVTG